MRTAAAAEDCPSGSRYFGSLLKSQMALGRSGAKQAFLEPKWAFSPPVFWAFGVPKNNFPLEAGVFQRAVSRGKWPLVPAFFRFGVRGMVTEQGKRSLGLTPS